MQGFTAAVAQPQAIGGGELVTLGVAAEVIVVVEQQDLFIRAEQLLIEAGGGQTADAGADDHQIVLPLKGNIGKVILFAIAGDAVGRFERARVVAAQAGEGGRVDQRLVSQRAAAFGSLEQVDGGDACCDGDGDAIEKISACDAHGNPCV